MLKGGPLYLQKRTLAGTVEMSVKCQYADIPPLDWHVAQQYREPLVN